MESTFIKNVKAQLRLKTDEIVNFIAQGDFVLAIDHNGNKHIINNSLRNANAQVIRELFFQINSNEIVNITYIEKFKPYIKNRLEIVLKHSKVLLYASNSRTQKFRIWFKNRN